MLPTVETNALLVQIVGSLRFKEGSKPCMLCIESPLSLAMHFMIPKRGLFSLLYKNRFFRLETDGFQKDFYDFSGENTAFWDGKICSYLIEEKNMKGKKLNIETM